MTRSLIPTRWLLFSLLAALLAPTLAARAQTRAPRPFDIVAGSFSVSRRRVRPGQIVRVSMSLRNQGPAVARSQRPSNRIVYTQGESFSTRGFTPRPGAYGVALSLSGPRGEEWPYRWGIGGPLGLGETRRVSFPLRLNRPGVYTLYLGVTYGDRVEQTPGGRFDGIEVRESGNRYTVRRGARQTPTPAHIVVNGKPVATDQPPVFYKSEITLSNVQILVPMRFVAEALGADVRWDQAARTAIIRRGESDIRLRAGSERQSVNGRIVRTHVPVRVLNGRTMVPIRFVSEALGGTVDWNGRTRSVEISLPALPGAARSE